VFSIKFENNIVFDENGFVNYINHEQQGHLILKNNIELCNNHVIPYNRSFLPRYNVQINIKIYCQSILITYVFKYFSKGSYICKMFVKKENNDEIKTYLNY